MKDIERRVEELEKRVGGLEEVMVGLTNSVNRALEVFEAAHRDFVSLARSFAGVLAVLDFAIEDLVPLALKEIGGERVSFEEIFAAFKDGLTGKLRRYGLDVPREEAERWAWTAANLIFDAGRRPFGEVAKRLGEIFMKARGGSDEDDEARDADKDTSG